MPHGGVILGLPDYEIKEIRRLNGQVEVRARYAGPVRCPHCGHDRLRQKDRFERCLRHESWGMHIGRLYLEGRKFLCQGCHRYFNQRFPGIMPRRRSTEPFRRQIFWMHMDGICRKKLAERQRLGVATVDRWFKDFLALEAAKLSDAQCPRILGIDEHFFTRKKGFATTLCDLGKHRIFDVVLGRSERALDGYFRRLKGKEQVRVVCIDMAVHYRQLIRKHFPNAKIVADRFHVIRLVNHYLLATWRELDPVGSKNRGLLSLMRRHPENLSPIQKQRLSAYLKEHPEIEAVYSFKQQLTRLLRIKHRTRKQCQQLIPQLLDYIHQLKSCGMSTLQQLGKTLGSWAGEIAAMWRFTKNNGITEGFHNKMEMISRRAYGFRNFDNYRQQVRVMCA